MKTPAFVSLRTSIVISLCAMLMACPPAHAVDLSQGLMRAVPAPNGPPSMDGGDKGWDLSGMEPLWMSTQLAKQLHASVALNYDDNNLYVYARVSLPGRKILNHNGPADPYWGGDCLELRLCSDPSMPHPLNIKPGMEINQVCSLTMWKDSNDSKDYIAIHYGGMHHGPDMGHALNPDGSKIAITETENQYVTQVVIPWSALNVPGGKNPFKPGSKMTAIFSLHWLSPAQFYSVNAVYDSNPGDFAFSSWGSWGQIEFSPTGNVKPQHGTMEEALGTTEAAPVGVPITIKVPEAGKLSVNIVGENGEVIRDVAGGLDVKPGNVVVHWDGRDQWGFALKPANYHWSAYLSQGLKARWIGFVGSSGNPPYATNDRKGGWGGDHGLPNAAAADDTGIYLGWTGAEAQRQMVKIDYAGNTLWRTSPFVEGGFEGPRALASNGKYLFAVYNGLHPVLSRLDPATGLFVLYDKVGSVPITSGTAMTAIIPPPDSLPAEGGVNGMGRTPSPIDGTEPECIGLAATTGEVFAAIYSQNIIQVLDVESGQPTRTIACPRPRSLALDAQGNLYAVSYGTDQPAQIVRFKGTQGSPSPVITTGLEAPVGVTVDASGQITVTDEGASQQIKTFSPDGKLVRTLGKKGGRPWAGAYDPEAYRDPSGIVADKQGGLVVAEQSIPKIFDRIDATSGKTLTRWFGWPGYGVANIPDSVDPMTNYFSYEPEGFARATAPEGGTGYPDAYWVPKRAGMEDVGQMFGEDFPIISTMANGKKYFIEDYNPHAVCLIDGDKFLPVGSLKVNNPGRPLPGVRTGPEPVTVSVWIDKDGDHKQQSGEVTTLSTIAGKPLPHLMDRSLSMWMDEKGDAYIITAANSILKIPCDGFAMNGAPLWNPEKASYVVPAVLPSLLTRAIGGRMGMPGLRTDSKGNIYTCLSAVVPPLTPDLAAKIQAMYPDIPASKWCAYATPELAKQMKEGLGHTAESNIAKFAKFGPDGKLIWMAGRKATAEAGPGEMYHFWDMSGLVGDGYVTGSSEWGPITFYTSDGFFVDSLMNDPATMPPAGPYTFGGENFSGQVRAFPKLGKVFAYDQGSIYAVDGFDKDLKVAGEQRFQGTVNLDKTYEGISMTQAAQNLQMMPVSGDITRDSTWSSVPVATLTRAGAPLATAQVGYDSEYIYAKIHVVDDTPLQNGGNDPNVVFKSGDVVGLDLGPAGDRNKPALGDVRILAAKMQGQSRLIGMKAVSKLAKQPQQYMTPASGTKTLDFVGDISGGRVVLTADADNKGYTALMTVPRSFVEFPITPGATIKGDVEVLLSGIKTQGLQAVSRNWLYSGGHSETTMTDDIPTEAWLYPQYWGEVQIK
ncbi:MAG: hypothetical protein WCD79_16550 [Chthoniobacteraceae bacterium]